MVEITKIECQRNKDKFNLFVDGEFYSGVLKEVAIANNFFVGKKLEKNQLDNIILDSESKQAFNKASDYLSSRLHTKQELKLKLIKKGYRLDAINSAIKKLEEYGYLNDENFAELFVEQNSKLSKQMILNKLLVKGVDRQTINNALDKISPDSELNLAVIQTQKYLKNKNFEDCKTKLYASLARKGFSFEVINKAVKIVTNNDLDWEN